MRAWLFVLAVLATFNRVQQVASTEEVKSSSSASFASSLESSSLDSNNVDLSDSIERDNSRANKPDPQTLVQIEKNLLSLFGFEKRPKVDRSKIVIPEAMKKLYAQIMGHELDSLDVPKADLHNKDANTIRSYTHEGESSSKHNPVA
jgi:bone morphogenetic protein 4